MAIRPLKFADLPPHLRALLADQAKAVTKKRKRKKRKKGKPGGGIGPAVKMAARIAGLPDPLPEHLFHPTRKWRFDWAWPEQRIAVEYEGLVFFGGGGRHQRASGLIADSVKYSEAAVMGWVVIRVTSKTKGKLAGWIVRAAELRREGT